MGATAASSAAMLSPAWPRLAQPWHPVRRPSAEHPPLPHPPPSGLQQTGPSSLFSCTAAPAAI